jgi:hypothetical protein
MGDVQLNQNVPMAEVQADQHNHVNDVWRALEQLRQENIELRQTMERLQPLASPIQPIALPIHPILPITKEPRINLPEKFDGTRSKFREFVNQVWLILQLQPQCYATEAAQVGFIGTLLSGAALSWFAPLLERDSPLLQILKAFLKNSLIRLGRLIGYGRPQQRSDLYAKDPAQLQSMLQNFANLLAISIGIIMH